MSDGHMSKIERLLVVDDGSINLRDGDKWHKEPRKECFSCYRPVGEYHAKDCRHQLKAAWNAWAPTVDLRSICRESELCSTTIYLLPNKYGTFRHPWLFAGQASLDPAHERSHERTLRAYLGRGATDFEHDSAYAFKLPLLGVFFERVDYHTTVLTGFLPPDMRADDFRVPAPGYNPFELDGAEMCDGERCGEKHPMVPEGCYVPRGDPAVLKAVRGRRVMVRIGPRRKEDG